MQSIKKLTSVFCLLLCFSKGMIYAHDIHQTNAEAFPVITLSDGTQFNGIFLYSSDQGFVFQTDHGTMVCLSPSKLSGSDRQNCERKIQHIARLNAHTPHHEVTSTVQPTGVPRLWFLSFFVFMGVLCFFKRKQWGFSGSIAVMTLMIIYAFSSTSGYLLKGIEKSTSPLQIDSAFTPFKPHVNTFWDNTYFYVESHGIPSTHEMMVGISNHGWQQQVPIPQCYIGANAWPIPLNPQFAANSLPIDSVHFTRGAIALAVNGVPIFNYHTNTGVDSYLDGQLDTYGGHCGRADDYHYHIAPLHLYNYTQSTLPIAYSLDGFPVYGATEPSGAPMQALDIHHGHPWNGSYHYHGTNTAPYMINSFAGQVTEDATHQLIPQAQATPVRPAQTPLNGALITACIPNGTQNGYNLSYTLNGQNYTVAYNWTPAGLYTFNLIAPSGTTSQNYNGFVPCEISAGLSPSDLLPQITVFPNPSNETLTLLADPTVWEAIHEVQIIDLFGKEIKHHHGFTQTLNIDNLQSGNYFVRILMHSGKSLIKPFYKF